MSTPQSRSSWITKCPLPNGITRISCLRWKRADMSIVKCCKFWILLFPLLMDNLRRLYLFVLTDLSEHRCNKRFTVSKSFNPIDMHLWHLNTDESFRSVQLLSLLLQISGATGHNYRNPNPSRFQLSWWRLHKHIATDESGWEERTWSPPHTTYRNGRTRDK